MKKALRHIWKRTILLALVLCLPFSTAAFAETATTGTTDAGSSVTMNFTDVPTGHWAENFVTKLALMGVVNGKGQGKFDPSGNITKQEAVVMAIGLMGLQNQVDTDTAAYLTLSVDSWAKGYVILGLDKKIIDLQEELANNNLLISWGDTATTREWVARLVIRAIGKEAEALALSSQATTFTDDAQIGVATRGYINEAVKLNIIKGKPNVNNPNVLSFDPQGKITRAEMAVMLSNAEQYLAVHSDRIVSGTLQELMATTIKIQTAGGAVKTFPLNAGAKFFSGETNKRIYASEIKSLDQVTAVQVNGTVYYVATSPNQTQYEEISGTLQQISLADFQLTMTVNGEQKAYKLASNPVVVDKDGNGLSASALTQGSEITVRMAQTSDPQIVQITVKAAPVIALIKGAVEAIYADTNSVKVKDDSTGIEGTYQIPAGVALKSGDTTLANVSGLHIGDIVSLQTKDSVVTSFELIQSSVKVVSGIVDNVNTSDGSIYIKVDSVQPLQGYYTVENVKVAIDGLASAELADVHKSDVVSMEVNANNVVTKISVQNRKVNSSLGAIVNVPYDSKYNTIILVIDDGQKIFTVSDRTRIEYNGLAVAAKDMGNYFPKDKKVDITYSGDQLISIRITSSYDGTLAKIDSFQKAIKINTANYGTLTFQYNFTPFVSLFSKSNAGLGDVNIGDQVRLVLDGNQTYVTGIYVKQTGFFTVSAKSSNSTQLYVKDVLGGDKLLSLNGSIPISKYNGQALGYNDLMPGDNIFATMVGSSADSIYVAKTTAGRATAVDSANGKLTVNAFNGLITTYTLGSSSQIVNGTALSTNLNPIAINDRVQIAEGLNGAYVIKKMSGVQKKFFKYNEQQKTVEFMRLTLSEQNVFDLADNVYVHQGNQAISLSSLQSNDAVMVYMLNNKIVEIEKVAQ